jgi:hypothetical protein
MKMINKYVIVSFIVIIFMILPSLTSIGFSMVNCYEIESGEYWLESDLDNQCWNEEHKKWFYIVALPTLVIWVFGMPVTAFLIMFCNRKKLDNEEFFGKFRMIY